MIRSKFCVIVCCLALLFSGTTILSAHDVAKEMSDAANLLLKSLNEEQAKSIQFKFDDDLRKDWQFIPMERKGLGMKAMKPHQRGLALSLVQTGLSHHGFSTAMQVMALEQVLHEMEMETESVIRQSTTCSCLELLLKTGRGGGVSKDITSP